jgi:hypothetical protein
MSSMTPEQLAAANAIIDAERASVNQLPLSMRPTWDTPAAPRIPVPTASATAPVVYVHPEDIATAEAPPEPTPAKSTSRKVLSPSAEVSRTREQNAGKRRGFARRPPVDIVAPARRSIPVDPTTLPPPPAASFVPPRAPSERDQRRARRRAERLGIASGPANAMSMVIDPKALKSKQHRDVPFLLPLIPSVIIAIIGTYGWFQGEIRLGGQIPWVPIFIGVAVGWMMKVGSTSRDFGRIGSAVIITGASMLIGESSLEKVRNGGKILRVTQDLLQWQAKPAVGNPIEMIQLFHDSFARSLLIGFVLMLGPIIAGAVASLDL